MNQRYLCVVRTEEDKHDMIAALASAVPEELIERAVAGKDAHLWLKNGNQYKVWSLEQWWEGITCGAVFDQVMYLVHPVPKYVRYALQACERTADGTS